MGVVGYAGSSLECKFLIEKSTIEKGALWNKYIPQVKLFALLWCWNVGKTNNVAYRNLLVRFECRELFELVGKFFPADRVHLELKKGNCLVSTEQRTFLEETPCKNPGLSNIGLICF